MAKITKKDIYYLFDELWPAMMYAEQHKNNCLDQFTSIENYFNKYSESNHNKLLEGLCSLEGIGITIGTGLIWSAHRNSRIPFDKFTTTYSLKLELIRSDYISRNYLKYSEQIKAYCEEYEIDGRPYEIEDFVREAMEKMEDSEFLTEPR